MYIMDQTDTDFIHCISQYKLICIIKWGRKKGAHSIRIDFTGKKIDHLGDFKKWCPIFPAKRSGELTIEWFCYFYHPKEQLAIFLFSNFAYPIKPNHKINNDCVTLPLRQENQLKPFELSLARLGSARLGGPGSVKSHQNLSASGKTFSLSLPFFSPGSVAMASRERSYALVLLFTSFALIVSGLRAHIADFDEYWQSRAMEAEKATREAYHPNPEEVTNHLNIHVHKWAFSLS